MPKRAQRLVFTASAPFSYALWLAGGFDGLDGLNGWLWRVRRLERHRGAREWIWKLDGRLDGRLGGQLDGQLDGHFSVFSRTLTAVFLTK